MSSTVLNEHDANQGAQSKGEFLGMTGNCGWWLLGSAGATVMMVIVLWGVLGVSLLLCILFGIVLCMLSVVYVFALKNNKPDHYDTDFFESVLVEAGVLELAFGPRARRVSNPFEAHPVCGDARESRESRREKRRPQRSRLITARQFTAAPAQSRGDRDAELSRETKLSHEESAATVSIDEYEKVQAKLAIVQDELDEVLAQNEEE